MNYGHKLGPSILTERLPKMMKICGGIYGLTDPRNGYLKYIGMSARIQYRYYDHCRIGATKKNTPFSNWLKELSELGLKPGLLIIEEKPETKSYRLGREELFWIGYFRMLGAELLNIRGNQKENIYNQEWYDKFLKGKNLPLRSYKAV